MFSELPIRQQLKNYSIAKLQADVLAGFTVAVTLIPQGLAYGSLARLPVQYGLYSGFIGGFIYLLFGTAKDITLGPTAIMSLFVAQYCNASIAMASAMTFYSGIVLVFAFGFLGFGGCISDFISHHVITGFCSAAAFITTITQIPKVLGLHTRGRSPISILVTVYEDLGKMNMYDCYIGFFSMLTLILLKNMPEHMKAKPFFKLLSTGRNAFLVFVLGNWTYMTCKDQCAYTLISITAENTGIKFETPELSMENFTYLAKSGALIIIPFMAFLESISIARTFGKVFNYRPDEFWESFAIGLSNIVGSYFGSFPVTGSFSRTALNASTGVQTTFGGIITSVIVIFALEFMLSAFHYIPKAALGAIIICAAANMFDPVIIKHFMKLFDIALDSVSRWAGVHGRQLRRIGRRHVEEDEHEDGLDASLACLLTFVICFYGLAIGILVGLGVSIVTILYRVSHPNFSWRIEDKDTLVVFTSTDQLSYSSCNHVWQRLFTIFNNVTGLDDEPIDENSFSDNSSTRGILDEKYSIKKIVVDLRNVRTIDHDVVSTIQGFKKDVESSNNLTYEVLFRSDEKSLPHLK